MIEQILEVPYTQFFVSIACSAQLLQEMITSASMWWIWWRKRIKRTNVTNYIIVLLLTEKEKNLWGPKWTQINLYFSVVLLYCWYNNIFIQKHSWFYRHVNVRVDCTNRSDLHQGEASHWRRQKHKIVVRSCTQTEMNLYICSFFYLNIEPLRLDFSLLH